MFRRNKKSAAVIEYVVLIMMVLGALYVMKPFISRAINGHWKMAGDSFGFSRQYQQGKTTECAYAQISADFGVWFDNNCYTQAVVNCKPGDIDCENQAKLNCGDMTKSYCCENNYEPLGHSNCSSTLCIPRADTCDAPEPECEQTTHGHDNCGFDCEKTGPDGKDHMDLKFIDCPAGVFNETSTTP